MRRLVISVEGRVQGVLFRHSARARAEALGLRGWAQNENDGSVTIVAEGEEAALRDLLAWCYTGPLLARVDSVKVEWRDASGEFKRFEIL